MRDGWEVLAAIATSISALVIGWQAWWTRKSVKDTEKTLRLTRKELKRGSAVFRDSQRARIDAEMPRLTIAVDAPTYASVGLDEQPESESFTMPRDAGILITTRLRLTVLNDGPRSAPVISRRHFDPTQLDEEFTLKIGEPKYLLVYVQHTLARWIELAMPYLSPGSEAIEEPGFEMTYTFPGDFGAFETHEVILGGSIVEPVPDDSGGWRLALLDPNRYGHFAGVVKPFTRRYWASRIEGRPL